MFNNKLVALILILLISFLTISCSTKELTKFSDDNSCLTTIEGNYYKVVTADCCYPAIFLKTNYHPKLVKGEILEVDSSGILFDPDNIGFYNEEAAIFPYDTLYGAVDTAGKIVYGSIPEFYANQQNLVLTLENYNDQKISKLILLPNEPFAYCIDPGDYKIKEIAFINSNDIEDIGYDFPSMKLHIENDKVNYLGNIYADYKTKNDENVIVIPCEYYDKSTAGGMGAMFGLVGAVAYSVVNSIEYADLHHVINIEMDKNFLPEADRKINELTIIFEEEE